MRTAGPSAAGPVQSPVARQYPGIIPLPVLSCPNATKQQYIVDLESVEALP
ncbi:MAG TPA: hypothetical protein VGP31_14430 [Planosporangium sp.]|nr:hypothetical protein [Planosporangium sp.]